MKRFAYSVIIIITASCGFDPSEYWIQPELKVYVDNFYQEAAIRGVSLRTEYLTVSITNLNGTFARTLDNRSVHINSKLFKDRTEYSEFVEFILFHELGHALLKRDHTKNLKSLMHESPCVNCYMDNRAEFLDELFLN